MPAEASTDPGTDEAGGEQTACLTLPDGTQHTIKLCFSSLGSDRFLDIRDLYAKTGCFTYDPGFGNTASCSSAITYVNGNEGQCLYRGYPVAELVEKSSYLEVAYLLLTGNLPCEQVLVNFETEVKEQMLVHEKVKKLFENFPTDAHPMAIMVAVVGALSTIFSELDQNNPYHRWLACIRLIAKIPTLAALAYKTSIGQPPVYPQSGLSFSENFLNMMFATPLAPYVVNPIHAQAIEAFLILHADHEQNASTSTVRIAASSQANPYACIAAGIASLWGPMHGGANQAVVEMLDQIGTKENIPQFLEDVKNKVDGVRLMGFGHRVYRNYDPRAKKMGELTKKVLDSLHIKDERLLLAQELEKAALSDPYFAKRKLYPNVDFYSGIMLTAIDIPVNMFTVLFAVARTCGWVTQWKEMVEEGNMRIGRPRQLYLGEDQRNYLSFSARSDDSEDKEQERTPSPPKPSIDFVTRFAHRSKQTQMISSFSQRGPDTAKEVRKSLFRGSTIS